MKNRFFSLVTLLVCLSLGISDLTAGNQPINTYTVYQVGRQFANGHFTLPKTMQISRPAVGTYMQGVVRVKTKATHGVHINERSVSGSASNALLMAHGMNSVSSAFVAPNNATHADLEIEQSIGLDRIYDVHYSGGIDPYDLCQQLMEAPDVEYAVPVQIHQTSFIPNDPRYSQQGWLKKMGFEAAWDINKGSKSIIIAIVDSGTDWSHEDLSAQIFSNPNETPNNSIDDDGNGFVDDVRGWDFVGNINTQQAQAGQLIPDNDPKVAYPTINGTNGHGTLTGGCAAASTNNAKGIASTGYNCTLLPVKVASDNPNVGGILQGYQGIRYAADMGAQIINCSWGGTGVDPSAQDVIDYATAKGCLVVAASGNSGLNVDVTPHNPSSLDGVLAVGSVNSSDGPSDFSNFGWRVDVLAPGENILSTFPNQQYQAQTGTSFSCPLTAGLAALIKNLHPTWTPEMIRQQLRSTSDPCSGVSGANRPLYYGRINAQKALKYNQSFSSGDRVPGITVTNVSIPGGKIDDFDQVSVAITLKNLLGDASNTTVKIESVTSGVEVGPLGEQNVGTLLHDATKDITLTVKIPTTYPWYEANIEVALTIQATGYTNFAKVNIPVELTTTNEFTPIPVPYATFNLIDYSNGDWLWATGQLLGMPAFVSGNQSGSENYGFLSFEATAMDAWSPTRFAYGGMYQGAAALLLTTNVGQSWEPNDVSSIMTSVASIHFFDDQYALAVGDPASNKIGIARSTNGGANWSVLPNAPTVSGSNEKVRPGSVCTFGDALWLATTNNRILYTLNKGGMWSSGTLNASGAVVVSMSFKDAQNGILLYKTSDAQNAPMRLARSVNGGTTWQSNVFDPATLGINALTITSPGGHHVLTGENGEVFASADNGATWQIVLSKSPGAILGTASVPSNPPMLLTAGEMLGILVYRYSNPNGTKILSTTVATLDYGSVNPNQSRLKYLGVSSSGESDVHVDSVVIKPNAGTPDSAFRITIPLDAVVEAGTTDQMQIRFSLPTPGEYGATLTIYSNATPSTTTTTLHAIVNPPTSVEELADDVASISPNPASNSVAVTINKGNSVALVDVTGRVMQRFDAEQGKTLNIDLSDQSSGLYLILVYSETGIRSYPLNIAK